MASEVQMINQAVDTAFAEEEAKDVEDERNDYALGLLENLEGALGGGLLFKETKDMIEDLLDRRTTEEKTIDLIKKIEEVSTNVEKVTGGTGIEDIEEDPRGASVDDTTKPEVIKSALVDEDGDSSLSSSNKLLNPEGRTQGDDNDVSANDYISGTNLKSFNADGAVVNQPWIMGVTKAMKIAFGWGWNRGEN